MEEQGQSFVAYSVQEYKQTYFNPARVPPARESEEDNAGQQHAYTQPKDRQEKSFTAKEKINASIVAKYIDRHLYTSYVEKTFKFWTDNKRIISRSVLKCDRRGSASRLYHKARMYDMSVLFLHVAFYIVELYLRLARS